MTGQAPLKLTKYTYQAGHAERMTLFLFFLRQGRLGKSFGAGAFGENVYVLLNNGN